MVDDAPKRSDPVVRAQKARQAANRKKIADALKSLQRDGVRITLPSVADRAGVNPSTVRRSGELFDELCRLRDGEAGMERARPATRTTKTADDRLRARLEAARSEVGELRRQLDYAMTSLHQTLGEAHTTITSAEAEQLRQESAELRVKVMALQDEKRSVESQRDEFADELQASHEINREYSRELTKAQDEVLRLSRELQAIRSASS